MSQDREKEEKLFDFNVLFLTHYQELCYYSYRLVGDTSTAEDLVQDVFYDLWLKKDRIDGSYSLKAYLYKIVYYKSVDFLRSCSLREEKQGMIQLSALCEGFSDDHIPEQEEILHTKDLLKEIQFCTDQLPGQCKKIFYLSRNKGLKNKEIAELLNISVKAVEKQITKALSEIRKHLQKKGFLMILFFVCAKSISEIGFFFYYEF